MQRDTGRARSEEVEGCLGRGQFGIQIDIDRQHLRVLILPRISNVLASNARRVHDCIQTHPARVHD